MKTAIAEPFNKIYNTKKISNKQFHHCEANIFLEKVTKFLNSQTNVKSSGNDNLTTKLYKHLSNELSFNVYQYILPNVYAYQFWENLGTMDVSSRTGVITAIYKKRW